MQFHISTDDKDTVTVHADETKIEVEDTIRPEDEDERSFRTIRFVTHFGQAIEVFCTADNENQLTVHRVKKLQPVPKQESDDWLIPTPYRPKKQ
jgi:hypothetical protein